MALRTNCLSLNLLVVQADLTVLPLSVRTQQTTQKTCFFEKIVQETQKTKGKRRKEEKQKQKQKETFHLILYFQVE